MEKVKGGVSAESAFLFLPAQHIDMTTKVEEQVRSSPNGSRLMQMLETYPRMVFVNGVPWWVTNFQICDALSKFGSVSFCWAINGEDNSSILLLYCEVSVHTGYIVKSCPSVGLNHY